MKKNRYVNDNDQHVMPLYGREHDSSPFCWCRPRVDLETLDKVKYKGRVWIHKDFN